MRRSPVSYLGDEGLRPLEHICDLLLCQAGLPAPLLEQRLEFLLAFRVDRFAHAPAAFGRMARSIPNQGLRKENGGR